MTATRSPRVLTGTHGPEEGAGAGTPWPDDVPPEQDDTWFPLRDDPWRARRVELFIAALWGAMALCGTGLMIVYWTGGQAQLEGVLLFFGFVALGIGLVVWARYLLPGHDITASRGEHVSEPEVRAAVVESLSRGVEPMLSRRGFLVKKVLVPAGGIFGIAALWPLASLGSRPDRALFHTKWYRGARLVTEDGYAVRVDDIAVGGELTVFPEGYVEDPQSAAVVINIGGAQVQARTVLGHNQAGFEVISGSNGIVAFSKICTHAGCPVSLFNVTSMQLICPCHQSTFDILRDCEPVFGPASRPLPQLPLGVRPDGYLVATSDFVEPVGPGFWNRGSES
jgi:ubiquinol-cytochrome c reductase iron-sulfur subunit